jgi:hypothetical protein
MATTKTYLELTNLALNELNEVELTSSNFTSSRGVQTSAKNFVNKAINELYMSEIQWPWLHTNGTQVLNTGQQEYTFPTNYRLADFDTFRLRPTELITNGEFTSNITNWTTVDGTPTYVSTGNGRLQLNDATVTQSISTIVNKKYRLSIRAFDTVGTGQAFKIQVGTVAEGTQNLSETLTVKDFGNGAILSTSFVATAQTTFVTINNPTTVTNMQVDYIRVSADEVPMNLKQITYDAYIQGKYTKDEVTSDSQYGKPLFVYRTQDHTSFGVSPICDEDIYTVEYEYFKTHTDLSAATDTLDIPDRYTDVIVNRAKYYLYKLRNDVPMANIANAEYEKGVERIRVEMLNRTEYMKDTRVNLNTTSRTTSNTSVLTFT